MEKILILIILISLILMGCSPKEKLISVSYSSLVENQSVLKLIGGENAEIEFGNLENKYSVLITIEQYQDGKHIGRLSTHKYGGFEYKTFHYHYNLEAGILKTLMLYGERDQAYEYELHEFANAEIRVGGFPVIDHEYNKEFILLNIYENTDEVEDNDTASIINSSPNVIVFKCTISNE